MKIYFDCIPCFLNQAIGAIRGVTDDESIHERVLRDTLRMVSQMDMHKSPPAMGQKIHRIIREMTGSADPYKKRKDEFNRFVLSLVPEIEKRIQASGDPFAAALRFAIAGNIIDFAKRSGVTRDEVLQCLNDAAAVPIDLEAVELLRREIDRAGNILYLGDNTGEIVFDRLFIEQMPTEKITFGVRGFPVINDATMEDARAVGLADKVRVIDNGSDAPGTILEDCPETFRRQFEEADLIIAKGQGNYETLSEVRQNIFFLLQTKCPVIARDLDCHVGDFIIRKGANAPEPEAVLRES